MQVTCLQQSVESFGLKPEEQACTLIHSSTHSHPHDSHSHSHHSHPHTTHTSSGSESDSSLSLCLASSSCLLAPPTSLSSDDESSVSSSGRAEDLPGVASRLVCVECSTDSDLGFLDLCVCVCVCVCMYHVLHVRLTLTTAPWRLDTSHETT